MKLQKDTKETIIMVVIVIIAVYILLWITYPRNVEQELPEPLDLDAITTESTPETPAEPAAENTDPQPE